MPQQSQIEQQQRIVPRDMAQDRIVLLAEKLAEEVDGGDEVDIAADLELVAQT